MGPSYLFFCVRFFIQVSSTKKGDLFVPRLLGILDVNRVLMKGSKRVEQY